MRSLLSLPLVALALLGPPGACANRGMQAPGHETGAATGQGGSQGGSDGDGQSAAHAGGGAGSVGGAGASGAGGTSTAGAGGTSAAGGASGGAAGPAGAGAGGVSGIGCASRFDFEGGALYGAHLNVTEQTAFTAVANGSDAFCGAGALSLPVALDAVNTKGEVLLPFAQAEDLSGKTISLALKTSPAGTTAAIAIVFLLPSYDVVATFAPIPNAWTTKTGTVASGPDAGSQMVTGLAIQVLGRGDVYTGTIAIDEIDIR